MQRVVIPALALVLCASAAAHETAGPADTARCAVWARETSFAAALAAHDRAGFAEHLHPDAVFGVNDAAPTRDARAIVQAWAGLIDGTAARLAWYPRHVVASAGGDLAWSTGPALFLRPDGTSPRIGSFQSVWQRGADGTWRVLFDGGTAPQPATDAQVAAFHAGRAPACPPPSAMPAPRG